jgi:hypothetical protein
MTKTDTWQTRPLVREGAPKRHDRNFERGGNLWSMVPDWTRHLDILTDWPSVIKWLWLWLWQSWFSAQRDKEITTYHYSRRKICGFLQMTIFQFPWSSGQSSWLHNGDILCFLWGMNWIYICYVEESRLPLWSSGQSSWLHNRDVLCFLW